MRYLVAFAAFALGISGSLIAKEITDVRVGNTAAISVATSADGRIVYVAHGNGFFKSTDGGDNWKRIK